MQTTNLRNTKWDFIIIWAFRSFLIKFSVLLLFGYFWQCCGFISRQMLMLILQYQEIICPQSTYNTWESVELALMREFVCKYLIYLSFCCCFLNECYVLYVYKYMLKHLCSFMLSCLCKLYEMVYQTFLNI